MRIHGICECGRGIAGCTGSDDEAAARRWIEAWAAQHTGPGCRARFAIWKEEMIGPDVLRKPLPEYETARSGS